MRSSVIIVRAEVEDFEQVASLLEEARAWLHARGIQQWVTPYPRELVAQEIERGEVYLAYIDGELAGTLTLQWSDEETWGKVADDAGYVHRLVTRRKFAARGLGLRLLRWAEETAASGGKKFLRLDCWAGNAVLCCYYESAGFQSRGVRQIRHWQIHLFEKALMPA